MKKILLSVSLCAMLFACTTDTKNRHVFHYVITGDSKDASELYGKMGPGIEFSSEKVDIPFEVSHEVYYVGEPLEYELRVSNADTSVKYNVQVFIDDMLVNSNDQYDNSFSPARVGVKGSYVQ